MGKKGEDDRSLKDRYVIIFLSVGFGRTGDRAAWKETLPGIYFQSGFWFAAIKMYIIDWNR